MAKKKSQKQTSNKGKPAVESVVDEGPALFHNIPHTKKRAFLAALIISAGGIYRAAKIAGCDPKSHYNWLKADEAYPEAVIRAKAMAADFAENILTERIVDGVERPIYYKGEKIDTAREFSDTLLIFYLKAVKPDKYREHFEVTGADGGPIETKSTTSFDHDEFREIFRAFVGNGGNSDGPAKGNGSRKQMDSARSHG